MRLGVMALSNRAALACHQQQRDKGDVPKQLASIMSGVNATGGFTILFGALRGRPDSVCYCFAPVGGTWCSSPCG
jgi:hypothetical protein